MDWQQELAALAEEECAETDTRHLRVAKSQRESEVDPATIAEDAEGDEESDDDDSERFVYRLDGSSDVEEDEEDGDAQAE